MYGVLCFAGGRTFRCSRPWRVEPLDTLKWIRVGYVEDALVHGHPAGPARLVDANTSMNAPVALS